MATNRHMYIVTGISRLTGERVAVSSPHSFTKCCEMRDKMAVRLHCSSAYSRLKVEPAEKEGNLW